MTVQKTVQSKEEFKLIAKSEHDFYNDNLKNEGNNNVNKNKTKKRLLNVLDSIIASLIVGPLIIAFWRGTWELFIIYKNIFPLIPSTLFSMAIHLCLALTREILQEIWEKKQKKYPVLDHIIRRLYMYFFSVISIMQWRGLWDIMDDLLNAKFSKTEVTMIDGNIQGFVLATVVSTIILVYSKTLINILDSPYIICLDIENEVYDFPTRFQVKVSDFNFYRNCIRKHF